MTNKDLQLMNACIHQNVIDLLVDDVKSRFEKEDQGFFHSAEFEHPLDSVINNGIMAIIQSMGDPEGDYEIYKCQSKLNELWQLLVEKSIKCLRFFDTREPYIITSNDDRNKLFTVNKNKKPNAYGVDALAGYFQKYTEFERILYGSSKYYRDHVVHVFRTWLSGVDCLVKNEGEYIKKIFINGKTGGIDLNYCEKLSIWTLVALTHDLGYPLEKAKDILDSTRTMVSTFISNPDITMDLSFHGVQNYMNDFVVRLISSRMEKKKGPDKSEGTGDLYFARLQPKYYFKFQKSLENTEHGIISTLIIYKLLTYFLESEYNINEDYPFNNEERRQFYIRREILRSIASHTCKDVYHLYMGSFPFLLIVADDTQEWGRKYISELYVESDKKYELNDINLHLAASDSEINSCSISEDVTLSEKQELDSIKILIRRLRSQSLNYITLFRDGQDTIKRDFSFEKKCTITFKCNPPITIVIKLNIDNAHKATFVATITYSGTGNTNKKFGKEFFESIFPADEKVSVDWKVDSPSDQKNAKDWKTGTVTFSLMN
jgi:hypothetical protein